VGEKGAARADLIRLAGQLKLTTLTERLARVAAAAGEAPIARLAATDALLSLDAPRAIAPLAQILADGAAPPPLREQAAQQLGQLDRDEARDALVTCLKSAPAPIAVVVAAGLAGHQASAVALLEEIQQGHASAGLLLEPAVAQRLKSSGLPDVAQRIAALTADLSPQDNRIARLIADRRAAFLAGSFDPHEGRAVFAKSICANCHRVGETGATIGPALDGIGVRGVDRLLEDTLDPSRNVDAAFQTIMIISAGGQTLSGFGLREEGANLVLNDAAGKQIRIPLAEVEERNSSNLSPMPTNVIEQMPEVEFNALMAYLLSLKSQ
jgi:putative heme-binding domain-containing protein